MKRDGWVDGARKYLVLFGCILVLMPVSVSVYFGNFIVYISSYYHANADKVTIWVDPLWLSSAFKVLQPIGMILAGYVERKTKSLNWGIALGAFMQSSSVVLSYWTVTEPLGLLLTFGVIQGVAGGILLALPYKKAAEVFPEKSGLAFGLLATGPSSFPLLHMLLSFYLINPDNRIADKEVGNIRYITDAHVISRVPPFFLKIGLFTLALQLIGFCLILLKKNEKLDCTQSMVSLINDDDDEEEIYIHEYNDDCKESNDKQMDDLSHEMRDGELSMSSELVKKDEIVFCQLGSENCEKGKEINKNYNVNCQSVIKVEHVSHSMDNDDDEAEMKKDFTPKEALLSCSFWKTWMIFALMGHTFFIHLNLYKQFGLTVINNDNLLVKAGTVSTFVLIFFRPLVGILSDKVGMKPMLVITCACSNVFMTMMPVSLLVYPPLYLVFVGLEFYAVSSIKVFYYMAPIIMFGPTHYATNVGLMSCSQWVTFLVGPVVVPILIKSIGWTYVIMSGAVAAAIAFFLSVSLPEQTIKTEMKNLKK